MLKVVLEYEKLVAIEVVVVVRDVDVDAVEVVVLYVVSVVARVTARKFDAKSNPSPAGQAFPTPVTCTVQAIIVIR